MKLIAPLLALCLLLGCASGGGPQDEQSKAIARAGGNILLDIADLKDDGATDAEKARLEADVATAITLVGADTATGQELARLLRVFIESGGSLDEEDALRAVARVLLNWATAPTEPPPAPPEE